MWKAERLLSGDGQPTRWMAEEGGFFVMHLGCQKIVKGFRIDNSQHKNKEGNKKDSFAFEILVRHAVAVLLKYCCYSIAYCKTKPSWSSCDTCQHFVKIDTYKDLPKLLYIFFALYQTRTQQQRAQQSLKAQCLGSV